MTGSTFSRLAAALLCLMGLVGCIGDLDLDADLDSGLGGELDGDIAEGHPALGSVVARERWEAAPAGCEGAPLFEITLSRCEDEPLLGALLDAQGDVLCVDSLVLLVRELEEAGISPAASDPSPQPSHPGAMPSPCRPGDGTATYIVGTAPREDPTPTPMAQPSSQGSDGQGSDGSGSQGSGSPASSLPIILRTDPTPTPITQPSTQRDPTPTPVLEL